MKDGFQSFGFGMPWEEAYGFAQALRSGTTLFDVPGERAVATFTPERVRVSG